FSTAAENPKWNDNTRGGRCAGTGRLPGDLLGQDKSGSPVERQAIDMACVQPCRSVGARAALGVFGSTINIVFGTMGGFAAQRRFA
ncbi:hypothetical protein ACQR1K_35105, partial [Bradyrhizobium sp. HKCCYLRH3095]|uniref:hypothetical protein n=1 Tax=Bradyrhizobium sp. HKCCYLRH3095 TaxID=3420765 RepID=UPI003EBB8B48